MDLRSTLHYYENVAIASDKERETQIKQTAAKLESILAAITDQLNGESGFVVLYVNGLSSSNVVIDLQIEKLRTEVSSLFDCPELQCYRVRPVPVDTFLFLNELDLVRSSRSSGTHRYARQEANTFICSGCRWYLVENG